MNEQKLPAWQDVLGDAEQLVRQKPLWSKFIKGTPLENDVPVMMADFALRLLQRDRAARGVAPVDAGGVIKALLADPVIAGMGARIRNQAREDGRPDPLEQARQFLDDGVQEVPMPAVLHGFEAVPLEGGGSVLKPVTLELPARGVLASPNDQQEKRHG